MKLNIEQFTTKLQHVGQQLRQHAVIVCVVIFGAIYAYLMWQVSTLSNAQPDADAIGQQLKAVSRPQIDQQAAKTMEGLEDQNVKVQAIFNTARDNPFTEDSGN